MNNITRITKNSIYELFRNGYTEYEYFSNSNKQLVYPYYGRLEEIEFLKKLYPLNDMPGKYNGYENAEQDIIKHTIANDDYDFCWVFNDDRFDLMHGNDTVLLKFLCAVFHPENRDESKQWHPFLEKVNYFIKQDGYELYEESKISGRSVYSYRKITLQEIASKKFLPFSIRSKETGEKPTSISKKLRKEIYNLFLRHNNTQIRKTETNYEYSIDSLNALIEDIREHYIPKAFDEQGKYEKTNDLELFILNNYPLMVFDAVEIFAHYGNNTFPDEVNLILKNNSFPFKLSDGKIEKIIPVIKTNEIIREAGLKELIEEASSLYHSNNVSDKRIAVEKLWDAFERLKTYYSSGKQKKTSTDKIIHEISNGNDNFKTLFNDEFRKLTDIGNDFRIRHHEMNKIDITDISYYEYFFQRCFALINLVLRYLK